MTNPKICPCCGQTISPDPDIVGLTGLKRRVYVAVREKPRRADELRDLLWIGTREGGPLDVGCLYTAIWQLNRALKSYGVAVRTSADTKHARFQPYRVVPL